MAEATGPVSGHLCQKHGFDKRGGVIYKDYEFKGEKAQEYEGETFFEDEIKMDLIYSGTRHLFFYY